MAGKASFGGIDMKLYKKNGIYRFRYVEYGMQKQVSCRTKDKKLAEAFQAKFLNNLYEVNRLQIKPEITFKKAVRRFIKESQNKSKKDDISLLNGLLSFFGEKMLLSELTPLRVEAFKEWKMKTASLKTINRYLQKLRALMNKARLEWMVNCELFKIRLYHELQPDIQPLTAEQTEALLEHSPKWFGAMIEFAVETGLRWSNVNGLTWNQVDFDKRMVTFHASQALKNEQAFSIPLSETALNILNAEQGKHPNWVFTRNGEQVKWFPKRVWDSIKRHSGVYCRFHDLRHTWATNHVNKGTPMEVLQKLGNWKDRKMVEKYAHFSVVHLAKWV